MTWSGWGASGGIVERVGLESARGGVEAEALYDSIRMAARLAQAEVHRAVLLAPQHLDPEAVLGLPVAADELATTLRPLMADVDCIVGPAVPITEFPDSLAMGQRLSALRAVAHSGPTFVDDSLLELVCVADPVAVRALRRKYFGELDPLPEDQRAVLVETLRQWLLQWGHRPGIAQALTVHPQTVSGRLHRLRDLLADDLEDAVVRAELLVLLTAEGPPDRRSLLCSPCQESDNRGGLPGPGCEPVSRRKSWACG
ncbi:helix-turn-helix domain-containing protein [Micrococcus luteus]|uniref:PucR family transcriptional regulator n=1 Tax=Micrococcus luteus TaxID=1270 RepID=UPI0015E0F260|nr:helix-turn-helix domain-containing protein [Micrococcus luteus]MCV7502802.1 helix-turn-helix domain-containing protein [Micrococcus luteus]MCV7552529.1 helix-turn-helix domain-containing protein [Micrococcus luteus]MCV7749887.1 helix-turn-helix domain-containing protein [Micrococcus luteus]